MVGANGSDARPAVAVIGAGIMGSAMTRNLVAAGVNTRVWDGSSSATAPLAAAAVGRALSPVARRRGRRARPPGHQRRPPGPGQRKPGKLAHRYARSRQEKSRAHLI